MKRVKVFSSCYMIDIEREINRFVFGRNVLDIKFQTAVDNCRNVYYSAMVIYDDT